VTERILKFVEEQVARRDLEGPVIEFGALQVPEQEGFADIRRFLPGYEFIGCDMRQGPGVDVIDDMENSSLAPCSAGTIFCLETLEHVQHPWRALGEAHRILKPGGTLVVSVPFRMSLHSYPDDYWRMTASALEMLLREAGFVDIEAWDDGADIVDGLRYPMSSFGVCRRSAEDIAPEPDLYRAVADLREKDISDASGARATVPFVIPLWGREDEARRCLEQLGRVTDGYSLVLVDNGFADRQLVEELDPEVLLTNTENVGVVRAINQGLDACAGAPYVAVMHSDVLVMEEGWLEHVVGFLESRRDVGLVAFAGRHSVGEDGSLDDETTVLNQELYPASRRPSWRFTEVAVADGMCFIMRNVGFRLDESLGFMHFYDLDISLQYVEAGYRIYVAGIDCHHLAGFGARSSREQPGYLEAIGGDDHAYYQEVRERFRGKWQHLLPITRGFRDEAYGYNRIDELTEELVQLRAAEKWYRHAEDEIARLEVENRQASAHISKVEREVLNLREHAARMEKEIADLGGRPAPTAGLAEPEPHGAMWKVRHYAASEGAVKTARRGAAYTWRKIRGPRRP
jgi:SAM-dependent methyltransferase